MPARRLARKLARMRTRRFAREFARSFVWRFVGGLLEDTLQFQLEISLKDTLEYLQESPLEHSLECVRRVKKSVGITADISHGLIRCCRTRCTMSCYRWGARTKKSTDCWVRVRRYAQGNRRVSLWVDRKRAELNFHLSRFLSGHGCFRKNLHRVSKRFQGPTTSTASGVGLLIQNISEGVRGSYEPFRVFWKIFRVFYRVRRGFRAC